MASSESDRAVQASKPCPVNVVSDSEGPLGGRSCRAGEGACVGHRVGGDDLGGRVLVGHRRRDVAGERRLVAGGDHDAHRGVRRGDDPVGPRDPLGAPARQVHRLGAADEVGRAGDLARVAHVDRVSCRSARSPASPSSGARASPRGPRRPRRGRSRVRVSLLASALDVAPEAVPPSSATAAGADTVAVARARPSSSTVVERPERARRVVRVVRSRTRLSPGGGPAGGRTHRRREAA